MGDVDGVDVAFVIDTTGSMGGFIAAAQRQMLDMIEGLARAAAVNMQLGVVEYRDHPPQDTMIFRVHHFTGSVKQAQKTILGLRPDGGGDSPEAVLDGVLAACHKLRWRPHARRLAVLVGDAPPHGVGAGGDGFPDGCPCGETIDSVTAVAETRCITVYGLGLTSLVERPFSAIAGLTGGTYFSARQGNAAIERLATILTSEFGNLELDRRVLDTWRAAPHLPVEALADRLNERRHAVSTSLVRLVSRGLVTAPGSG